jgi:bifunctional non-homologous end joining protein LigD
MDPPVLIGDDQRELLRPWDGGTWHPPALATLTDERFSSPDWVFERKFDGVRIIAGCSGGRPVLWTRNRKRADAAYPEVVAALADQGADSFVADGEVVAFEGERTSFARLQHRIHLTDPREAEQSGVAVYCYFFDLLQFGGVDVSALPLLTRKHLLAQCFDFTDPLRFSAHRRGGGDEFFRQACDSGWEGVIAKQADRPYPKGRTRDWLKFKCVAEQEFVVGGYTDPKGTRYGFGALLVGYYDEAGLRYAGKVGTGYTERTLRALRRRMVALRRTDSPFADPVPEPNPHWIHPELVVQVGFSEWTGDGRLRHPRYSGLRNDKRPRDVVRER